MKLILVPTDGSQAAEKALDVALDLATQHAADLALMHVLMADKEASELLQLPELYVAGEQVVKQLAAINAAPEPEHTADEMMWDPGAPSRPVDKSLLRQIGAYVLSRAKRQAAARGVEARVLDLGEGKPAEAIVAAARAAGADTIIMGTRGLRAIEAVTFGSVSQAVCRLAPCSCIAVH